MTLTPLSQSQFAADQRPEKSWPEREGGVECASNISPAEQRKRLASGVIGMVLGLAILTMPVNLRAAHRTTKADPETSPRRRWIWRS